MYMALPSPPPWSMGIWHVTHSVWHSCVLPVRNSPKSSVMLRARERASAHARARAAMAGAGGV